ncbi:hypothetical protein ACLK1S_08075 [Escherichia coli]
MRPRLARKVLERHYHAGGLPIALPHALAVPSLLEQLLPKNSMAFIFLVVPAMCSRTYMVKMVMSLTPIPG